MIRAREGSVYFVLYDKFNAYTQQKIKLREKKNSKGKVAEKRNKKGKIFPRDTRNKNNATRQTWQLIRFCVKMLYVKMRLKLITKAKVPVINFLYRVSLQKTFYNQNYKKAGAALVRTITSLIEGDERQVCDKRTCRLTLPLAYSSTPVSLNNTLVSLSRAIFT